jgi:hypothetical protein
MTRNRTLTFSSTQLKPIPIPTDDAIKCSKVPGLVVVHGSVTFVDEAHDYFCLTPSQYVSGATQNGENLRLLFGMLVPYFVIHPCAHRVNDGPKGPS